MKLYLDSANLDEVKKIANTSAIAGVTTNPSLIAKEDKRPYIEHLKTLAEVLGAGTVADKHLSVEVITSDPTEMVSQAENLYSELVYIDGIDLNIKIPLTVPNLAVVSELERRQVPVNVTACMTSTQAKLAMDAGATTVSFFYNRMKDGGDLNPCEQLRKFDELNRQDVGWTLTDHVHQVWNNKPSKRCHVICGSIRHVHDVYECWEAGADAVTVPMKIITRMASHPETDKAIIGFQGDIDRWLNQE